MKNLAKYMKQGFLRHGPSGNKGQSSLSNEKQARWALQFLELMTLREFPGNNVGWGDPSWAQWITELRGKAEVWGGSARKNSQYKVPEKRLLPRDRGPETCRGFLLHIQVSSNPLMHVKELLKTQERIRPEMMEDSSTQHSTKDCCDLPDQTTSWLMGRE